MKKRTGIVILSLLLLVSLVGNAVQFLQPGKITAADYPAIYDCRQSEGELESILKEQGEAQAKIQAAIEEKDALLKRQAEIMSALDWQIAQTGALNSD